MFKKVKRLTAVLLAIVLLASLAACGRKSTDTETGSEGAEASGDDGKTLKIGFSIPTEREERWKKSVSLLEEKVSVELGAELIVQSADNDSQKQYSQIENMITQGIDVLLVAPEDAGSVGPVLDRCHEEGIFVIGYTRTGDNCWMDAYMTFDFETIGRYQAEAAVEMAPKGNYVLCMCDDNMTSIAVPMREGVMSVLQPLVDSGDINIVLEHAIPNVDPSIAMADVENALTKTNNDIQAIIAVNDAIASGCISALASAGMDGEVYVSGMDAEKTALKRILEGTQSMTTLIDLNNETDIAIDLIKKFINGEADQIKTDEVFNNGELDIPQVVYPPIKVTENNIHEVVIDAGYYTLEEIESAE
ncbi:D-xylose transport system substrate-binding protein [Lachnospiraceae bacterium PF1-22]|uniref:substrate-binding domain-containing protein n=1 Tax=Ohessyouella blattaphilus TaxID=2949333 RepID=UPI003E318A6E